MFTHLVDAADDVGGHLIEALLHLFEHVLNELVEFFGVWIFCDFSAVHEVN